MKMKIGWLLNRALMLRDIPGCWKKGRTVLIPKCVHPTQPSHFRPITITPVITRLLHKVLATRLSSAVNLPTFQKGFKKEEGCASNLLILKHLIKKAKSVPHTLAVAFIDFMKAFDSVSHGSILRACQRLGLTTPFILYVQRLYQGSTTCIGDRVANVQSGVLQGDPLSPLLFNIVLDWVLSSLPQAVGAMVNGVRFQYFAFADDIVLTASSRVGLQLAIDTLMEEALKVGLRPGPAKCATLTILADKKRKTWYTDPQHFLVNGERIRALDARDFYKYLGAQMGQNIGNPEELIAGFSSGLTNVLRAPMKPQQKFYMIQNNLIPKFLYPVLHTDLDQKCRELDLLLRRGIRTLLH